MSCFKKDYDVIIAGAGTAGCIAAIQASRAGAKTLLIEKNGMGGGTMTVGGVNFPGLFHAWGKQVISGIGWELVSKTMAESNDAMPDFSRYDLPHYKLQVLINPYIYGCLLDEAFAKSGVDVLYHTMPVSVKESDEGVLISVAAKEGLRELKCSIAVDTTGDADLIAKAGYQINENSGKQPATLMFRLGGYDVKKLDLDSIDNACEKAIANGELDKLDYMSGPIRTVLGKYGNNSIHLNADNASTSAGRSELEQRARGVVLKTYRFLRRQPGLEKLELEYMTTECGIRETATIAGEKTITADDYVSGRHWSDSLCFSFYPIDLHQMKDDSGLMKRHLAEGVVPTIPRGALIPHGSKRLLAAGRIVSSDQLANSALRVQASCMAMGQVAGAMAVLSAENNIIPSELDIPAVKELLEANGAIVP